VGELDHRFVGAPMRVETSRWRAVRSELRQTIALRDDDSVWTFGENEHGALGTESVPAAWAPIALSTCALD